MSTNTANPGQAQMDAYRTALRKRDFPTAIRELVAAIQADPRKNAPFPVGKYLPQRILRTEPAGVSFLCWHKDTADSVVVKALNVEMFDRPMDTILAEARVSQQVDHPVIIRVRECGYVDPASKNRPYIVSDYFDGIPLDDYVMQNGPLPVADMQELAVPLTAAMQAAHDQNLIHRNLRPQNVLVRRASINAPWEVRLIDLGLAVRASAWGIFAAFAAPEQLERINDPVGKPTDIYGFAKTCAHAMFQTALPQLKHWKSIPTPLAEFLERCLAENPADRPGDFHAVARCFSRVQLPSAVPTIPTVESIPTVSGIPVPPPVPRTGMAPEPRRVPVAPVATPRSTDDGLPDYQPIKKGTPIGLILLVGGGLLAFVFLGLLGIVLLVVYGGSKSTKIASNTTSSTIIDNNGNDPPPIPPLVKRPNGGNNDGGGNFAGGGNLGGGGNPGIQDDNFPRTIKVKFKGVPNAEAAKYIEERLKHVLDEDKNASRRPGKGPAALVGNELTAEIQTNPGARRTIRETLNGLELGPVVEVGDTVTIDINPPPEQNRVPVEKPAGQKLQKAQIQAIRLILSNNDPFKNNEREQALRLLGSSDPSDDGRAAIRQLLRLFITKKDVFQVDHAIRALGAWGTEEDAAFLTAQFPPDVFGSKEALTDALAKLRSPQSASFLAQQLGNAFSHERVMRALRAIGTPAEKSVAASLTDSDRNTRIRAAQFLKDYGSGASIKALQSAAQNTDKEAAKAAWDAWKTIAFHNPKIATTSDDGPPPTVVEKPTTETIDDIKVTTLSKTAGDLQSVALALEGNGYYTLEREGSLRRWSWEGGTAQASASVGKGATFAVNPEGILVAGGGDAKMLDSGTLESKSSGAMDPVKSMSAATKTSLAVVRCDSATCIRVLDLQSFTVKQTLLDKNIRLFGKSDPTVTPDGKFVFTRDGGKLFRWVVAANKMGFSESSDPLGAADGGQIVISPDSKWVSLFYPDGNDGTSKIGTLVFAVGDLKKPAYTIAHSAKMAALGFDNKGMAYACRNDGTLTRFDAAGAKVKTYKLSGAARQLLVSPRDDKLLILTDSKLLRVDLRD